MRLHVRQRRLVAGGPRTTATLEVRGGAVPLLFPKVRLAVGPGVVEVRLPFLTSHAEHTEEVELPDLPRGVHAVGPVTWQRSDPVGLVSRTVEAGAAVSVLVAPRVVDLPLYAGGLSSDVDGAASSQVSMNDLAFHALREYVQGDDLRHVHWRSSAKAGELQVRQYHESRRGHVTVLLDGARASYARADDFELAVSVAASVALRAARDDLDTYLRCGEHLAHSRDALVLVDAACRFACGDDDHLAHAAEAAVVVGRTGLVVQVTGSRRDLLDLDRAARPFTSATDLVVVRAGADTPAAARVAPGMRELCVPDLAALPGLLAGSLR